MNFLLVILFLSACFLAYSNGANDNFKGVATLFGSNTMHYKGAISWATITTLAGSIAAIFIAGGLVKNFSGKGLVPMHLIQTPEFAISIALGAAITVFIATRIGMPISTTHSLVGALLGSGVVAVGMDFNFSRLAKVFLMPLFVSPFIAGGISLVAYLIFRFFRQSMGLEKESCICVGKEIDTDKNELELGTLDDCEQKYKGAFLGIKIQKILDVFHYISSGIVSFSRGLNDTPKIVGLLVIASSFISINMSMVMVAIIIAIGGLLSAEKVGKVMSKKITPMNSGQGFTANLVTGLLVTTASIHGLPVSTTHVSVGAIFGIGTATKKANIGVVRNILLSWLMTLPIAAFFSGCIYYICTSFLSLIG